MRVLMLAAVLLVLVAGCATPAPKDGGSAGIASCLGSKTCWSPAKAADQQQ